MSLLRKLMRNACRRQMKGDNIKGLWHGVDKDTKEKLKAEIVHMMHGCK